MSKPVRVMKFGGTSVGDASCIARAAQIVAQANHEASVVVVVSAMSGVTDRLVAAATRAETGDREEGAKLAGDLRNQHELALKSLIPEQEPVSYTHLDVYKRQLGTVHKYP